MAEVASDSRPLDTHNGAVQDDEALFLFALIRVMDLKRVLEIGGLDGYSATNFVQAVGILEAASTQSMLNPVVSGLPTNHITLRRDAGAVTPADVGSAPLDLLFFDCHVYDAQMALFHALRSGGMITDRTILSFHDTNLYPHRLIQSAYQVPGGWVHQPVERQMVNEFRRIGIRRVQSRHDAGCTDAQGRDDCAAVSDAGSIGAAPAARSLQSIQYQKGP